MIPLINSMSVTISTTVFNWLRELNVPVSKRYIRQQLLCHPDYPSVAAITDVLDELGIDNAAMVIDKERIKEELPPFLACDSANGGTFIIVKNSEVQLRPESDFGKIWNGIAIFAAKPEKWNNAENERWLFKERKLRYQIAVPIVLLVALTAGCLINHFSWQIASLLFSVLLGLGVVILIVLKELGFNNELTEQFCKAGKNIDCDFVMQFKGGRLGKWINWADAGIIYFSSFLFLLTSPSSTNFLLAVLSVFAIPFTFYSLYYQWQVVKKWCTLCLIIVAVLWLQFALLLPSLAMFNATSIGVNEVALVFFILTALAIVWMLIVKPSFNQNKELIEQNYSLQRFKNRPDVFMALLGQQRKATTLPFEGVIQLGNPTAPLQITVVCNPYCNPCAKTHELLDEISEKNNVGLSICFYTPENKEDKRTKAVIYLLQLLSSTDKDYKRQLLRDWYSTMDIEAYRIRYPLPECRDVDSQLREFTQWAKENDIKFTPTIFLNGCEMPRQYYIKDLNHVFKEWKNNEETVENNQRQNEYVLV